MVQRAWKIDSFDTQLVHDYDFDFLEKRMIWDTSGVLFSDLGTKPEFSFNVGTGALQPWKCIIMCTRTASLPIANQKVMIPFESSSVETLSTTVGNKVYIEVNDALLQDPSTIIDVPPATDFAQGLNLAQIKSTASYPSHSNYIKLREITAWPTLTDMRVNVSMSEEYYSIHREIEWLTTETNPVSSDDIIIERGWQAYKMQYSDIKSDIVVSSAIPYIFWDWSDGDLIVASWTTTLSSTVYNYNNIDIAVGATLWWTTITSWAMLNLKARWNINISWSINMDWMAWPATWTLNISSITWVIASTWSTWLWWAWWVWSDSKYDAWTNPASAWTWNIYWGGWGGGWVATYAVYYWNWGSWWTATGTPWTGWVSALWWWWDWWDARWGIGQNWDSSDTNALSAIIWWNGWAWAWWCGWRSNWWSNGKAAWWGGWAWWKTWYRWWRVYILCNTFSWSWSISAKWLNGQNWGNGWAWSILTWNNTSLVAWWGWGGGWGGGWWGWAIVVVAWVGNPSFTTYVGAGPVWIGWTFWVWYAYDVPTYLTNALSWTNWSTGTTWNQSQVNLYDYMV